MTSTPMFIYADEEPTSVVEQTSVQQAKKTDGSNELTDIAASVLEMLQNGEISFNEETQYLEDAATGQKVNPQTGERVDSIPTPTPEATATPTPEATATPQENSTTQTQTTETKTTETTENEQELKAAEEEAAKDPNAASSNEELISRQQIVEVPEVEEDFRFWTVARKYAFAKSDIAIREEIPANTDGSADTSQEAVNQDIANAKKDAKELKKKFSSKESEETSSENIDVESTELNSNGTQIRTAGSLEKDGVLYILEEESNGWLYVESGTVRGFVKASELYTEDAAEQILKVYQSQARKIARKEGKTYKGIESVAATASEKLSASENEAFTYLRATAGQTVADKIYALANVDSVNILEEEKDDAKVIGTLNKGNLCYILAGNDEDEKDSEWLYVESGDVRGFVRKSSLTYGDETSKKVEAAGESSYTLATELTEPEDNQALYYTLTSTTAAKKGNETRKAIIEYASQFIGNPYVYGGNSLTNGIDCSGFTQQIYSKFGVDLPRTSAAQSQCGTHIAVSDAQPGDLIFYAKEGHVYHVAMYAGDGKTIEAADESLGILCRVRDQSNAVWASTFLSDEETDTAGEDVKTVNADESIYGQDLGKFTISYYCACENCSNKAGDGSASGETLIEGDTIAVNTDQIPEGTQVIIGGHVFTAQDCGREVQKNHIDVYVSSHEQVEKLASEQEEVYLVK